MTSEQFPEPYAVDPRDPLLKLPKCSLHDHLDGGLRPDTILELAADVGYELPASDAAGLRGWFAEQCDSGDLERYLQPFGVTTACMQTTDALRRVAREWVADQAADGVVYAEARWAPEQHVNRGLELDDAVDAVQAGIDDGIADAALDGRTIMAGQLVTAMRHADRGEEIARLALRHRDNGVVGFDIAGPEDGFPPSNQLAAFELLHRENFPATIHAGEASGPDSIWEAVQLCHAQRIGHGVRLLEDSDIDDPDDIRLGRLTAWVLDRQVPLELCPSSNLQTGAAKSIADHPINWMKSHGFNITVNPDNRLMSATSMTREMRLLVDEAGWDTDDLMWVTINGLESSFLDFDSRLGLLNDIVLPGYESVN